jgi:RNA polymerase sigma-70 factor (ECF subfamily)
MQNDSEARQAAWAGFEAEAMPHIGSLFRAAMWFERDRDEAEDLVQETLRQALESFHRYTPGTNCRAWLMSILQHIRSNRRRAKGRSPVMSTDVEERLASTVAFVPPVPEHLTDDELLGALRRIPPQYQDVIVLSDVEELDIPQQTQYSGSSSQPGTPGKLFVTVPVIVLVLASSLSCISARGPSR